VSTHPVTSKSIAVEKEIPIEIDAGLLCATDLNPVDEELYKYAGPAQVNHTINSLF
jgi:regulator of ribosome biosynthesis